MLRIAGDGRRADPRPDLPLLRGRGDRGGVQRPGRPRGHLPELLAGDFAVLIEPTNGDIEGGCQGTLRVEIVATGIAAHSARPWMGHNAIHDAAAVLRAAGGLRGRDHHGRRPRLPRGAPGRRHQRRHRRQRRPRPVHRHGQLPLRARQGHRGGAGPRARGLRGLRRGRSPTPPTAPDRACTCRRRRRSSRRSACTVNAKYGWTDVARFSALGIPAVNYGPGDPNLAHMDDERCPVDQYVDAEAALLRWLR